MRKIIFLFVFLGGCKSVLFPYMPENNFDFEKLKDSVCKYAPVYESCFITNSELEFKDTEGNVEYSNAVIQIKKDDFIQLSIRPAFGIENMRLLFTQDSIKCIDFHNKTFFCVSYFRLCALLGFELNFKMVESFLLNDFSMENADKFSFKTQNKNLYFEFYSSEGFRFTIERKTYRPVLIEKEIDENRRISLKYSKFKYFNQRLLPSSIKFYIKNDREEFHLKLNFLSLSFNKSVRQGFKIPKGYKRLAR